MIGRTAAFCAAWLAAGLVGAAAQQAVGLSAPLSDQTARLGIQLRQGAEAAAIAPDLVVVDDACTADGGAAAARQFTDAGVALATGFLCTEAIEAALPILTEAGIPVLTTGVRTDSLTETRDKTGWQVFRLAPRAGAEDAAVAAILTERWRDELFAIVDDGTIYGRDLAETFRLAAEQAGLKPAFVDTFRPGMDNQIGLAGRLRRAGATHVFVGGERDDIATLAQSAAQLDYDLTIAGGEALRSAGDVPLAPGILMIGLPEWAAVADPAVVEALRAAGVEPEGYVLPGYVSAQIAEQALAQAAEAAIPVAQALAEGSFQTVLGTISFDANGDRTGNPYRLFRYDGSQFVEVTD